LWGITLVVPLIRPEPWATPSVGGVALLLLRSFLHTGLFIVGHDAMHGSLVPCHRGLNHAIGRLALLLYACLPYGRCRANHVLHHRHPGEAQDPDFHDGRRRDPLHWYLRFLGGYLGPQTLAGLIVCWGVLLVVMPATAPPAAVARLLLVAILPLVLSSLQLFFFGTYLPHRQQEAGGAEHRVGSSSLPPWLSFLACYHFGYHREHHAAPSVAWYALPRLRRCGPLDSIGDNKGWGHAGDAAGLDRSGA
jgi:beta-carotene ketolase (CrtW type)